ncbi:MAG: efflux transporter outer membrane subunit [Methylococcales bacterium]|nr:efflux transporter outer membrane subunit [Methylococcales bacterium]
MNKLLAVSIAALLSGCTVGPDYIKPEINTPTQWRNSVKETQNTTNSQWWKQLNDPVLNRLIEQAIQGNYDLKIAIARVDQYMGLYGSTRSNLFPKFSGSYNAQTGNPSVINPAADDQVNLSGNMNWQIDIWGELRRANEAALANLLSQEATQQAVMLTLVSEIAKTYVNLRELDKQLEITKETVAALKEGLRINTLRFTEGYTSNLEVQQNDSEYQRRSAQIPQYEQQVALTENALAVLLGSNPRAIERGLPIDKLKLPAVPSGLPSDLLVRRPDIARAEQQLIAANAQIGVARAQYFPNIRLTGNVGQISTQVAGLFTPGANFWTVGSAVLTPIFTAGKIAGDVRAAEAVQKAAVANYRKTIITGFSEFENALISLIKTGQQQDKQNDRVAANKNYYHLSKVRYEEGYVNYLVELDAIRQLFDAQIELTTARADTFKSSIDLYLAMGGGWIVEQEKATNLPKPKPAVYFP